MIRNWKCGADIEVMLRNETTNEIVSAEGYIKGTKQNPFSFDPNNKWFATSLDNVLAEFNIPPANTKEEFYANIQRSLGFINNSIPKDMCIAVLQAHSFDSKFLQTENARLFGCEPDYNAYTGEVNPKPFASDENLRSAGGHIHLSYEHPDVETNKTLVKFFDLHIGIPSVILEPDNKRKELYGKAGCYRNKDYGFEYRTISNFYILNKELTIWAYEAVENAVNFYNEGHKIDGVLADVIEKTINSNDKETAKELISHFKLKLAA